MVTSYEIVELLDEIRYLSKELYRRDQMLNKKNLEIHNLDQENYNLRQEVEYYKSRLKSWEDWANPSDNWGCYT